MDVMTVVYIIVLVVAFLYAVAIYNNLVSVKHAVSKSWSNIDVLLKQRHDELPKLVHVCQQYMKYEQETLEKIVKARSLVASARESGDLKKLGPAESSLRGLLGNLFALAEAYPDLKANNSFQQLQNRISGLENSIADRREFYNESVNRNNVRIEQFPDVLVARIFGFRAFDLLEFNEEEKQDVNLNTLFAG